MLSKLLSSQIIIYHCILFLSFSSSVNYFVDLEIINYLAYVCFHLTLIYLFFYFFHFSNIFVTVLYAIFFDIFLVDNISPHLITFLAFVALFYFTKKYLLNLSSRNVSYIIFILTLIMFISEALIANLQFNYPINFENLLWIFIAFIIIFYPTLLLFSKIDKL
ncbi:MAG: hypothetical protein ACJ0RC_06590 [Alphaproteobacteria bacterium]